MKKLTLQFFLFILLSMWINIGYAQTALPYSINFGTSQEGWTSVDNSETPGVTWGYLPKYAYIQGQYYGSVVLKQDWYSACDDYYISPGFELKSGKTYTAEVNLCCQMDGNDANISFKCGTSKDDISTFSTKFKDLELNDNSEYPSAQKIFFGVPSDGTYYFAFHNTSPIFNCTSFLFEFKLYEGDSSGEITEEVVVKTPYSVDLRTDYKDWSAVDSNGDGNKWEPMSGWGVMLGMALSGQHDDLYFSPKVSLKKGQVYKITTNVTVQGIPQGCDFVTLKQGVDKDNLTSIKQLSLNNSGENIENNYFTPESDGDYYFAFYNSSVSGGNTLSIYSFAIEEYNEVVPVEKEIFSEDFSNSTSFDEWTIIDENNDGISWEKVDGYNGPSYDGNMAYSSACDWLVTPSISLDAGKDYLVRYTISQAGAFEADNYEIRFGTSSSVSGMTNILISESIELGSGTLEKVVRLTCTKSGNSYIGFKLITPNPNGILTLDKISVLEAEKPMPNPVEGLKCISDFKNKSVTLEWKNPSFDTAGAPVLSGLDINVYENGIKVATLEEREAGASDSYVYNPEVFGGVVSYQVTASINGIESLPSEFSINLDDWQGEQILLQDFSLNNVSDFEEWYVENVNGGVTWEYVQWDSALQMKTNCSEDHNDWAITYGVNLKPGNRYVINFDVSTSESYPGNLKVWLGNARTHTNMTTELISLENICYNGYVKTSTQQFSVETEGTYYIGFQAGKALNGMKLKNVNIYYIDAGGDETKVFDVPYTQLFDESTATPEGWKITRSSGEYGFYVLSVRENAPFAGMNAPSRPNALIAKSGAPAGREEVIITPKFSLKGGETYNVSFMVQMFQQNSDNIVSLYKATEQDVSTIVGDALIETSENTMFDWKEQKATLKISEDVEYAFVIKVNNNGANGGAVMIDNFKVDIDTAVIPVEPVTPAAVNSLRGWSEGGYSIGLSWSQPVVDVDGNVIPEGSVIKTKVYDGEEFIGETEVLVPVPETAVQESGILTSFKYTYDDNTKCSGQKIYKCVPYIENLEGPATATVVELSSFTTGYLKEHVYSFDFSSDKDSWAIFDNDNDNNTWTYEGDCIKTDGKDEWIISPELSFNTEKSYYVVCEFATDMEKRVNITFTRGYGQKPEDQTTVVQKFENVMLCDFASIEIGETFGPEKGISYLGIHVENEEGAVVEVRSLKVMRMFTMDEPVELPYEEDFENRLDIDEATNFTNKWGRRTSTSQLFNVTNMSDNAVGAHSGEYAVVANEFDLSGRNEILFTPYFTLEEGKTYEISFYLYMPGNGDNITTGQVIVAYTQDEAGLELPVIFNITERVEEWTQFKVRYVPQYDMDYCLYFQFDAVSPNSGIIAFDDFKIEKVTGEVSIDESIRDNVYYVYESSILYLTDNIERISVFNMQGQKVMEEKNNSGEVCMSSLDSGVYIINAVAFDGSSVYLKINK